MTFFALGTFVRGLICMWTIILLCVCIIGLIIICSRRLYRDLPLFIVQLALLCFMCEVQGDLFFDDRVGYATEPVRRAGQLPAILWIAPILLLTVTVILTVIFTRKREQNRITPDVIRICADKMPCGIAYFRDDGRNIFSNELMRKLCIGYTGKVLSDGQAFYSALENSVVRIRDRMWHFAHRTVRYEDRDVHELIATDVTVQQLKTEMLEVDRRRLVRMNSELKQYEANIDETVRLQEILQAKIAIHDEMNRIMLTTVHAIDSNDEQLMKQAIGMWKTNMLLLKHESNDASAGKLCDEWVRTAGMLGISLKITGQIPDTDSGTAELLSAAVHEAAANAAKHAHAGNMEIGIRTDEDGIRCEIANDGALPEGEIRFSGGLSDLRRITERRGGTVVVKTDDMFRLVITIPAGEKE